MEQGYLKKISFENGASLFGICDLPEEERERFGLKKAIVIAIRLSDKIIDMIMDRPTMLYSHHYKQINYLLDRLALLLSLEIQNLGYTALPIPASQIINWKEMKGDVSHKRLARLSGIGWIGKSSLLVSKEYGARIRLVSILTDIQIPNTEVGNGACGGCKRCIDVCPIGAISNGSVDIQKCLSQLEVFRRRDNIGHHICGICVKACYGKI